MIPVLLVNTEAKLPITSRIAKKLYKEKNRGPKVSREEQRRIDREEVARQNREYKEEQAAARAKAARDRKVQKKLAEKEKRKKDRIPEPRKGIQAS